MQVLQELKSTFQWIDVCADASDALELKPPSGTSWRLLQVINLGTDRSNETKFQIIWVREVSPCPVHPGTSDDR